MRNIIAISLLLGFVSIWMTSCNDSKCTKEKVYTKVCPVYKTNDEVLADVASASPRDLKNPGKIFFWNNYIFVSETNEGVHIINNSDPMNPVNEAFITIPGNMDIAVQNNVLYADMYADIISLDIRNLQNVTVMGHIPNIFRVYSTTLGPINGGISFAGDDRVVVDYETTEVKELVDGDCQGQSWDWNWQGILSDEEMQNGCFVENNGGGGGMWGGPFILEDMVTTTGGVQPNFAGGADASTGGQRTTNSNSPQGQAGSMARFTIRNNILYVIDYESLKVVDISDPSNMNELNATYVGWAIETVFPYENNLFIGANAGMYIYSISDPVNPTFISMYTHINACDPVVVQDDIAYVTLRSGTACQNFTNQLEVIDVSVLTNPTILTTYEMFNPHGLGVDQDMLFICDGDDGLKVYDKSDIYAITDNQIDHFKQINAFDVIPAGQNLIMTGADGIYQYEYANNEINQISVIPVQ